MARRGSVAPLFALVTMVLLAGCGEPSAPEASVGPIAASVTVAPAGLTLTPGEEAQLTATVTDSSGNVLSEEPLTWSSSNPAVATVSPQGAVRALGVGSANITATAQFKNGSASITVVPLLSGIIVSEPVRLGAAGGQGLVIDAGPNEFAYVSLAPGTVPGGDTAAITNLARGAPGAVPITNGGFDPVQIQALAGDTLEIRILRAGQVLARTLILVPARKPPIVVRTDPPKDKTGVPLNAVVVVVFSEPVDGQKITTETINLRLGQQSVDGVLTLSADGLFAVFDPVQTLASGAAYTLVVTTGVADLAGDALEQQVEASFTTEQTVSPQGVIAFERYGYDTGPKGAQICRLDLASSITTCLALGHDPAWSPDGSKIAFLSGDPQDIYVMNADGSGAVNLTNSPESEFGQPVWSPDGQKIAYTVPVNVAAYYWDVFVMNADGSNRVNLTANPAGDFASAWSPDGSMIAFDSDRDGVLRTYVMNPDGSNVRRLSDDQAFSQLYLSMSWSPDGSKIVFTTTRDGNLEIYVMNADGTGAVNLTSDPARDRSPAWSPDGKYIVFNSWRGAPSSGDPPYDIYVMNADGSGVLRITATEQIRELSPHWGRP